jgi:plastocyanin
MPTRPHVRLSRALAAFLGLALVASACGDDGDRLARRPQGQPNTATTPQGTPEGGRGGSGASGSQRIDPRTGGLGVALGEWAVTPEALEIRPGPLTFVIANRGTIDHGFEIELVGEGDGDNSGPGSGGDDGFKRETAIINPGETVRLTVNLVPGDYKVECLVEGHDDLGMENIIRVRADAPLVRQPGVGEGGRPEVSIEGFAFAPRTIRVETGQEVTWTNADPTAHTVTAQDQSFDSDPLDPGTSFSAGFDRPGTYAYFCAIHPDMTGTVRVVG